MRSALYILIVFLFTACSSVSYLGIETYNPAEITFPDQIGDILVVNHAVPQPADAGYEYLFMGVSQDTCKAKADSALFYVCQTLGKEMVEAGYFNDVLLYELPTRKDDLYYRDEKLTKEEVEGLCEETGTDAIISLDRLMFNMKRNVSAFPDGYLMGLITVEISAVIRTYLPGRENPLATVLMNDSIFWTEESIHLEMLNHLLPSPDEALQTAGQYIGYKASPNFVPHWQRESRWYFTGMSTRWKQASTYAVAEKWDQAAERWQDIYDHSSKWKDKAKSASNIALAQEMKGNFTSAYEWAVRSKELFEQYASEKDNNTQLLKLYVASLADRIRSEKKLNIQFGEK